MAAHVEQSLFFSELFEMELPSFVCLIPDAQNGCTAASAALGGDSGGTLQAGSLGITSHTIAGSMSSCICMLIVLGIFGTAHCNIILAVALVCGGGNDCVAMAWQCGSMSCRGTVSTAGANTACSPAHENPKPHASPGHVEQKLARTCGLARGSQSSVEYETRLFLPL